MITMLIITCFVVFVYLLYPIWLRTHSKVVHKYDKINEVNSVSVIYLSKNSDATLKDKLHCLLEEISVFSHSELIVIDDGSTDKSSGVLSHFQHNKLRVILKGVSRGIPDSMNLGVQLAQYNHVVFCDQRQCVEKGIIRKLVEPLKYETVGCVSSCVSNFDKSGKFSIIRAHENSLKKMEGRTGNLIGVYGPLYAIKKECYKQIPDYVILDDLYLTLHILSAKKVLFLKNCRIIDNNLDFLYNYSRTKRYLTGFVQILKDKQLLSNLSTKQIVMLFWHKYLRILIPLLLLTCFLIIGIKSFESYQYRIILIAVSILVMFVLIPLRIRLCEQMKSLLRFISYYTLASLELLFSNHLLNKKGYGEGKTKK